MTNWSQFDIIYYFVLTPIAALLLGYFITRLLTPKPTTSSPSNTTTCNNSSSGENSHNKSEGLLGGGEKETTSDTEEQGEKEIDYTVIKSQIKRLKQELERSIHYQKNTPEKRKLLINSSNSSIGSNSNNSNNKEEEEEEEEEKEKESNTTKAMSFLSSKKKTNSFVSPSGSPAPLSPGFAPRACSFKKFGCSGYLHTKNEYDSHLRDEAQFHLQLVVEKFDQQFDLHTQLMAHFTEQMEDQLDRTMKVVKNHMDSFGTSLQGKLDEGVEKCMTFAKKVEQQQQQLAKRLITQAKVSTASPIQKGISSEDLDGAAPHNQLVNLKQFETEINALKERIKREASTVADELTSKLEKKTNLRIDLVESDLNTKADKKSMMSTIEDTVARKQESIETAILKRVEEKERKKTDQTQLAIESKLDVIRDKIKSVESVNVDLTSDVRKLKLEGSGIGAGGAGSRSSVSLPTFNKSEVLDEIKKVEQQLNDKISKTEKKIQDDIKDTRTEITDLTRKTKQNQTDIQDAKVQSDKQTGKIKQLEEDLRKSDSLLLLVQNNLKKHGEFFDREKEREADRQKMMDTVKLLEANQKKIEQEIAEGNEQVERVLREESIGGGSLSPSVPRSPLLSKRNVGNTSSPQMTSSTGIPSSLNTTPRTLELNSGTSSNNSTGVNSNSDEGENGILWEYDPIIDKWIRLSIKLRVERKAFAEGALRQAYHTVSLGVSSDVGPLGAKHVFPTVDSISPMSVRNEASSQLKQGTKFVLKLYKKEAEQQTSRELYFEDVKMQMVCRDWGHRFNQKKPPKKIEFLMSWVVELVDRGSTPVLCSIEPLLVGEFKKNNSNYGAVLTNRSTPQAFSHFTYENSAKQMIIVDIQGVDDLYTDPQIHTNDGKGFGLGNLGKTGINKFITSHKCNAVCALLDLDVKLGGSTLLSKQQLNKGTMIMPDIVNELGTEELLVRVGANELPKVDFVRKELKAVNTVQSFRESINCVSFFEGNKYLCAGYGDGSVRVFDIANKWSLVETLYCHRKPVTSLCTNSKYIFTSSQDQTIKVHSLKNPHKPLETLIGHSGEVSCIRANETHLYSCSYDKTIRIWDLNTFKEIKSLEGVHTKYIKTLCLSGRYLFSGGNDQTIYVWDTETYTCLFNMQGHGDWVLSLQVFGNYLFSTAKDNQIKIWDLSDFHCIETLNGHWNSVSSCTINDRFLYSGAEDNSIKVWDMDTLECVYTITKAHSLGVKSLAFYNGNQLISASFDGSIKIWEWNQR